MTTFALEGTDTGQLRSTFGDALSAPPAGATCMDRVFEAALTLPRSDYGIAPGFDAAGFMWRRQELSVQADVEYVKLERGAWLVFGEFQHNEPLFMWMRENRAVTFSVLLRGASMIGTADAPHLRSVYTEGSAVGTACSGDTLICRHPLPGLRYRTVSLLFNDDEALSGFGLDPGEARSWITSVSIGDGRTNPNFSVAVSNPNLPAMRAAQAILLTPFTGMRRRLYLRSKAGELMCHLLSSPAVAASGADRMGVHPPDDDSLAALAHAAMSDPEAFPEVGELAARLQVSTGRLVAAFKAKYGKSPSEHAAAIRMARARRLLLETRMSLLNVALSCGYEHHSSFSTAYRRTFGETPFETRRAAER